MLSKDKQQIELINLVCEMDNKLLYHFFSDDDFLSISAAIKESEKITSGEIRISIKEKIPFFKRNLNIEKLAEEEFYRLEMNQTRDKTGILFYLLLDERQFHIVADEGINSKVGQKTWDKVRDDIKNNFVEGRFSEGVIAGIKDAGKILSEHFPIKHDDTNELSNKVVL